MKVELRDKPYVPPWCPTQEGAFPEAQLVDLSTAAMTLTGSDEIHDTVGPCRSIWVWFGDEYDFISSDMIDVPRHSRVAELQRKISGDAELTEKLRNILLDNIRRCRVTSPGICPAIGAKALEEAINRTVM